MIAAAAVSALIVVAEVTGIAVGWWLRSRALVRSDAYQDARRAGRDEGFALAWRRLSAAHRTRRAALAETRCDSIGGAR